MTFQYYDQIWNFDRQKRLQDTEAEDIDSYLPDGDGIKRPFINSAIVSVGTIIFTVIVCTLGGYALTILNTPFKN